VADLPACRDCGKRDQQRLLAESEDAWYFACLRCLTRWIVTKPVVKARVAYQKQVERLKQLTAIERRIASRTKYFT
jgi:hypothetical protein